MNNNDLTDRVVESLSEPGSALIMDRNNGALVKVHIPAEDAVLDLASHEARQSEIEQIAEVLLTVFEQTPAHELSPKAVKGVDTLLRRIQNLSGAVRSPVND